jgi:hypothetical protein
MVKKRKRKESLTKRLPKLEDLVYASKEIVPLQSLLLTGDDPYPGFEIPSLGRRGRLIQKFGGSALVEYEEEEPYIYTYKGKTQKKMRTVKNRYPISLGTQVKHLRPAKKRGRKNGKTRKTTK